MGNTTLRKALDEYKDVYMPYRNFAERTRVEYLNDLKDLVKYLEKFGNDRAMKLKLPQIERYLAKLESRGFAGATRKRKTVTIRSFLKFLYQDGYIDSNLAKQVIPPFIDRKLPNYLTKKEYNRLREACAGNVRDAAIVEILLQTGIRLSELTGLITDDIELQDGSGVIRIRGSRGKEGRSLPLNRKASQALSAYLYQRQKTYNSALFLNRFGGPIGDRGVQKMLSKYLGRVGLGKASAYTLRHTFGTHHAVKGTSPKTIQATMGYKDTRSTSLYLSLAQEIMNRELQDHSL